MNVTILFHSYFRDLAGCSEAREELPESATLAELRQRVFVRFPKLKAMERSTLVAVGLEYQTNEHRLRDGDEISFFPPVQGG